MVNRLKELNEDTSELNKDHNSFNSSFNRNNVVYKTNNGMSYKRTLNLHKTKFGNANRFCTLGTLIVKNNDFSHIVQRIMKRYRNVY